MNHTKNSRPVSNPPVVANSKRIGRPLVGFALVIALFLLIQPGRAAVPTWAMQDQATATQLESKWRYTRYGWQNPADWLRTPSDIPERFVDRLDPILVSANIFLAVLGATIWASEEWQVARLLGREHG